jgi:hypothetical protein
MILTVRTHPALRSELSPNIPKPISRDLSGGCFFDREAVVFFLKQSLVEKDAFQRRNVITENSLVFAKIVCNALEPKNQR